MNAIRWATLALITIAATAGGFALYLSFRTPDLLRYQEEWVKALLQAGVIAVLGVVTSAVLETFKDGLQRVRDQSRIRFDVLADISRIYMDVKLIRRRAQAAESISTDDLHELNERQVRLELHKYNSVALFRNADTISAALDRMEKYLNGVANKPDSNEHRCFRDKQGFRTFSSAFHEAVIVMQQDIADSGRRFVNASTDEFAHSRNEA